MGLFDILRRSKKDDATAQECSVANARAEPPPETGSNASGGNTGVGTPPAPSLFMPGGRRGDPVPARNEYGGYLIFDPVSNGTLFLKWSEQKVANALAFFSPKKPVPAHKFKNNGGKQEIFRNLMSDKAKYYEGWCQFFKTAVEFAGECSLLPGADSAPLRVTVAFLCGTTVKTLHPAQALPTTGVVAVGCVPGGQRTFDVLTMHKDLFLGNARKSGAALTV
ncbi:hypothetical protein BESB_027190 [Besnoitia besnoiti]|uniref:Immune mapped protein 2 N-terminal domain-containing protein n=1 Tax=Besnoitia besnoiti TaxID=94643 RepID=A0A2A9M213_BESBE|nr:uncharacterized protein BESB_027190 [Besnoitia besnoiti]PFH31284.1 hypothetical protein BESB_027190 [Besnoitia besnoiti]